MEQHVVHRLVKQRDLQGLRAFLSALADPKAAVNRLDEDGISPLFYAVSSEKAMPEIVRLLLDLGADHGFVKVQRMPTMPEDLFDDDEGILGSMAKGLAEMLRDMPKGQEFRDSLLSAAIKQGDLDTIRLLRERGADLSYKDENGYTAVLDAVHGGTRVDRAPLLRYLIGLGLDVRGVSSYGESAVKVASHQGQFGLVADLLAAGADEASLGWTSLIKAVALGTFADVERELAGHPDLKARDAWDRTALHVALTRADLDIVRLLLLHGARLDEPGQDGSSCLAYAVESGNAGLVAYLIEQGCEVDGRDAMGRTCLALAAELGSLEMVRLLLELGADPAAPQDYTSVLECAANRDVLMALLGRGADPREIKQEQRRMLLALGEPDGDHLAGITREEYLAGRHSREGRANPEEWNSPFRVAMIRAGVNAYRARTRFDDPANISCGITTERPDAVWCADRFGQTLTMLPDGRTVLVGGEHEDYYDPDFRIYNDVWLFEPDGRIRLFVYPYAVFPATDFHSATLVGGDIYIIGSLGYAEQRKGETPVRRLSTIDFHIETVKVNGDGPGRIFRHRATLVDENTIRVEGGTIATFKRSREEHTHNTKVFDLDLKKMAWSSH